MNSLEKLFREQLADIHYAEKHILTRLPKMAEAAKSDQLTKAFKDHEEETQRQIERIEQAFESLGLEPDSKKCEAAMGLLREGDEILDDFKDTEGIDAALICAGQKVEHYEIATYGCLVTWAKKLGHDRAAELLAETLNEEENTDERLTDIAVPAANAAAAS